MTDSSKAEKFQRRASHAVNHSGAVKASSGHGLTAALMGLRSFIGAFVRGLSLRAALHKSKIGFDTFPLVLSAAHRAAYRRNERKTFTTNRLVQGFLGPCPSPSCVRRKIVALHKALYLLIIGLGLTNPVWGGDLSHTIEVIKPSIVGIGTFEKTRSPSVNFLGTGFAVGDGSLVVTNVHVVPALLEGGKMESLIVLAAKGGKDPELRNAVQVAVDKEHDLALLKISGEPLPAMQIGDSNTAREGQVFAFTGFPIGMILGFHPVTHRGMLSSITPIVLPAMNSKRLDGKMINQIQKSAYTVFQLDGTAYPGNSGSPLFDPETGIIYGVINMVFVKGLKETAISQPSGITYAIPGNYVRDLLQRQ